MKWLRNDNYSIPIVLAVSLHLVILVAGVVVIDLNGDEQKTPKRPPIVNATVIDISQTIIGKREAEEKVARQQAASLAAQKKKEAEQKRQKEVERKALEEKQKQLAKAKKIAQEKEDTQKKAAEKERLKEQQQLAKQAESKRLAKEAEQKRVEELRLKEKQRKEEALAQKAEAERKAEEERKREEEAARLAAEQKKAEEAAAALAAAEEERKQAAEEAQMVQSISGLINDRVTANWTRPPSARNGMKTYLRIYFLPNGEVRNVDVTKSSGDGLFDQKAVDAVYKVRKIDELSQVDSYVFERNFRQVDLIFNPQDLRN